MEIHDPYVDSLIARLARQGTSLAPLEVQLVQPPPRKPPTLAQRIQTLWRDRLLFALVIILLALGMYLWFKDIRSLVVSEVQYVHNDELGFAVKYSSWLVARDEESFTITLVNNGDSSLNRVTACLVFSGTVPVGTGLEHSNVADFQRLEPDQRKTRTIKLLPEKTTAKVAQADLWVSAKEWTQTEKLDSYTFDIASVPYLKRGIKGLGGALVTGVLSLLVALLKGALTGAVSEE